jgi:HEAT repeat protein
MFAVRQRRRWANSATPKPCPRSSKHWGIIGMLCRRAAAEALGKLGDPQAVPPLKHCGRTQANDAARRAAALGHPMLDLPQAVAQVAAQGAWGY